MSDLSEKIQQLPQKPGVYLMKDAKGAVLYIGKATNLKKRVSFYFQKGRDERYQISFLMRRVVDIETIITDNEKEALLLENSLIKQHQPRYNLFLKDDKSYPSLKINVGHSAPGLFITRNVVKDGSEYFGPYTSAFGLRQTMDMLTKFFRLRTCSDNEFSNRSRPCLKYDIGRCTAPCVGKVTKEAYQKQVEQVLLFLKGKGRLLLQPLQEEMERYSATEQFEEAARIRDLMVHIQEMLEIQKVVRHHNDNYDVIGWYKAENKVAISVLGIRQGSLMEHKHVLFAGPVVNRSELLASFLVQYYGGLKDPPPEVVIPSSFRLDPQVASTLDVAISAYKTGKKARMQKMAEENAKAKLHVEGTKAENIETLLAHLQTKLGVAIFPHTIECVDISNIQGRNAVGVIIAFTDGKPDKQRYRRFKIRGEETPNDYRMMFEVLERRFKHALSFPPRIAVRGRLQRESSEKWKLPDLLLVDGGKGQLAVALKVLADLGLHSVAAVAIAKERDKNDADKIYLPGRKNPVNLKPGSKELLYLMRIRDEAHRFAIAYHRKRRSISF